MKNNLKEILEDLGVSQRQLAKATGLGDSAISKYCNRGCTPSVASAHRVSSSLGYRIQEIWPREYRADKRSGKVPRKLIKVRAAR